MNSSSQRSDHQCEAKQENEQKNASVLHQMLFSTVTLISVKFKDNFLTQDLILWETLIAEMISLNQWDQRKQICETVCDKELYKDIETSLIEILLKISKSWLICKAHV